MRRVLLGVVYSLMMVGVPAIAAQNKCSNVSGREARSLVIQVLKESGADKLPSFSLERETNSSEFSDDYYWFGATWSGTPDGSVVIGHYAVDKTTGDIWNATSCMEFRSLKLQRLQKLVRDRAGLNEEAYKKLRKSGPYCS